MITRITKNEKMQRIIILRDHSQNKKKRMNIWNKVIHWPKKSSQPREINYIQFKNVIM